jgi:hypothetical protein
VATAKTGYLWVFGPQVYAWTAPSPTGPWQRVVGDDGQPVNVVPPDVTFPQPRMFYGGHLNDGILVFSTLIGVIFTGIDNKLTELRKGRSFVVERGHTIIFGWSLPSHPSGQSKSGGL